MGLKVVKRDGKIEEYNSNKIYKAIESAAEKSGEVVEINFYNLTEKITNKIIDLKQQQISIEQIQSIVEHCLMVSKYKSTAKAYIEYRHERDIVRESKGQLLKTIEAFIDQTDKSLLTENANKASTVVTTHRDLLTGLLSKHYTINHLLDKEVAKAHNSGFIHVHDADYYISPLTNCIDEEGWITVRKDGVVTTLRLIDLKNKYCMEEGVTELDNLQVLSRNGWSKIDAVSIRKLENREKLLVFKTRSGLSLKTTEKHRIPILRDGNEIVVFAEEIREGDHFLSSPVSSCEHNQTDVIDLSKMLDENSGKVFVSGLEKLQKFLQYKTNQTAQQLLRTFDIKDTKNFKSLSLKDFNKLRDKVSIPYDVVSEIVLYRKGAKAKIPLLLQNSRELARMFGYIFSDGCVSKSENAGCYQVTFSNTNAEYLEDFKKCLSVVFPDVNYSVQTPTLKSTTPCTHVVIANGVVWEFFNNFKKGAYDISIPNFIMDGDEGIKYSFLSAAIDGDGHWSNQVRYTTVCEKYAQQFLLMLEKLDYHPTYLVKNSKGSVYKAYKIVGTRNYDTHIITLNNVGDINRLCNMTTSYKAKRFGLIERKGVDHDYDVVRKITEEYKKDSYVFDLETSDSWFIVNGFVVHNCSLVNYRDMLENGFYIGDAFIEQPKSIGVAATILTQIIQSVASGQFGGQTSAHIDSGLASYVEKSHIKLKEQAEKWNLPDEWVEEQLEKEVYDAMQTFLYQVNSLTTTNGQTPFITISFGLDTSKYGRMITKAYLQNHIKGVGKDKVTPVFPKVIFFLEEGINLKPEDVNYDLKQLAIDCATKRIYPDFISVPLNKKITGAKETAVTSMSCRSFLSNYVENGKEKFDGRYNLGVVTLNLPMIAKESVVTDVPFECVLNKFMDVAYKAHMGRVDRLKGTKAKQNPTMFVNGALARLHPEETIDKLFYNGYASISIGFIGLAETCEILKGKLDKQECINILKLMRNKVEEYKEKSNIGFSLYGTPSESYCQRAVSKYEEYFNEKWNKDYFTNSFHLPVWVECSPFEKWEYESGFADVCSGGFIGYIEQPSLVNNKKAYETFIDYAYPKIPYFGINTPVDKCFKCGFEGEFNAGQEGYTCPDCGNHEEGTVSVIRRVSGYLSAPNSRPFNEGKQQECMNRVKHS